MKLAVLVPSHIYYPDQLSRLDKCINSLCTQTIVPDIFVSISFANETYKREFGTLLRKYPAVKFKLSSTQKFQMEHLLVLSFLVCDYDMIMFCDDDDTYKPFRVEIFKDLFEKLQAHCEIEKKEIGGVREAPDNESVAGFPEYWAYGIEPALLTKFFAYTKGYEDLLCHKFADMYLRTFLRKIKGCFAVALPAKDGSTLYEYDTKNPNSICARHQSLKLRDETANILIKDTIILGLICNRDDIVKKQMKYASIPVDKLSVVVPDVDRIKSLTKRLYDQ